MTKFLMTTSIAAIIVCTSAVHAQEVPASQTQTPADSASGGDEAGIQDIIVTASRRQQSLQNTALSVSAVTSDEIIARGVNNVSDITRLLPAVKIGQIAGSSAQVTVRGIGNFGGNSFAEPGVAFNLDGVYVARSAGASGIFYDVSRIELLKGPQGTLYGRNSTGGVLNIITNDPNDKLGFDFNGEVGNAERVRVAAAVNVPINDAISVRIAGQRTKSDGFTSDGNGSEDNYAGRIKVKIQASSNLRILLEADYAKIKDGALIGGFAVPGYDPFRDVGSGPNSLQNLAIPKAPAGAPFPPTLQVLPLILDNSFNNNSSRGLQGTVDYDFGPVTSTLIVANRTNTANYRHYGAGFPVTDDNRDDPSEFTTAEFRLASDHGGPFKWVVGAFYFDDDLHTRLSFDQGVTFQIPDIHVTTKSYSGFAEGTYSLNDALRFTAGGRYTSDKKAITGFAVGPVGAPFAPLGGLPTRAAAAAACPTSVPGVVYSPAPGFGQATGNPYFGGTCTTPILGERTFSKFTWKLGMEADIGPQSLLYASVSTGFKSGGFYASLDTTEITSLPASQRQGNSYIPETLTAYTVGLKNRFFDNTLQLNAEAFYWKYKNKQFSHLGIVQPGDGNNLIVDNAGAAEIYGIEIDALWQPTENDVFNINLQYSHAEYTRFSYVALFQGPRPATTCAVGPITPGRFNAATVDCSGRPVSFAPEWTLNVGYNRTFDLGKSGKITAGVNSQIQSSFFVGEEYLPGQRQKSSTVTNAELGWREAGGNVGITAFVKNIEKSRVLATSFVYPFTGGIRQGFGLPTTYGMRLNLNF